MRGHRAGAPGPRLLEPPALLPADGGPPGRESQEAPPCMPLAFASEAMEQQVMQISLDDSLPHEAPSGALSALRPEDAQQHIV
eukprot:7376522-Alexandrium_andersonii.AAC.1